MLGKLTRWLRMLGHNVKYSNKLDDAQLITIAKKETRILLTRDLQLYQQATAKGVDAFYLEGKTETEKLAELAKRFKIKLEIDMTQAGVFEPLAVKKQIIKSATEAASMILKIDDVIAAGKMKTPPTPPGGPPGMGGMGPGAGVY